MSAEILNALKAEEVLKDTTILGQTLNLKDTLKYKTDRNTYSFEDYFHILNSEIQGIERIELSATIPPGGAQSYLAELSTALQLVTDKVESAHTKAIYFEGKLKSASHLRNNLQATFAAWYLIALSEKLKFYDIKLAAKTQTALAESEFSRLVGDEDLNIDGLISAVEVMIVHLKEMKKIANEKYKLGSDQANAAIVNLPFNGVADNNQFSLLKQRWGLKTEEEKKAPIEEDYDDLPLDPKLICHEVDFNGDDEPAYIQRRESEHTEIPEGIHKILSASVVSSEEEEVTAEDLQARAKKWHQEVEELAETTYTKAEDMFRSLSEEELAKVVPLTDREIHAALEQGAKDAALVVGKTTISGKAMIIEDAFAGTVKIEGSKAELIPLKKRQISFDEDDDLEMIVPKTVKKSVMDNEDEFIQPKKKKTVSFDDEDVDFGTDIPAPKPVASKKKIVFDDEEMPF